MNTKKKCQNHFSRTLNCLFARCSDWPHRRTTKKMYSFVTMWNNISCRTFMNLVNFYQHSQTMRGSLALACHSTTHHRWTYLQWSTERECPPETPLQHISVRIRSNKMFPQQIRCPLPWEWAWRFNHRHLHINIFHIFRQCGQLQWILFFADDKVIVTIELCTVIDVTLQIGIFRCCRCVFHRLRTGVEIQTAAHRWQQKTPHERYHLCWNRNMGQIEWKK